MLALEGWLEDICDKICSDTSAVIEPDAPISSEIDDFVFAPNSLSPSKGDFVSLGEVDGDLGLAEVATSSSLECRLLSLSLFLPFLIFVRC